MMFSESVQKRVEKLQVFLGYVSTSSDGTLQSDWIEIIGKCTVYF